MLKKVKIKLDLYSYLCVYSDMKKREKMSDSTFGKFNPMALREKYSAGINFGQIVIGMNAEQNF